MGNHQGFKRLRRSLIVALALISWAVWQVTLEPQTSGAASQPRYGVIVAKNVMVPMRDGVRLAIDIYRPALNGLPVEGKFPVILERTPYDKARSESWTQYFAPRGYIAVAQDVRGRFASEGTWRMHRDDGNDGYDAAKWLGEQPWCDGNIGTVGTSYPGGTQHALALSNPPYLKTMIPVDAMSDYGRYGIRHNGAFELRWMNWIFQYGAPYGSKPARDPHTLAVLQKLSEQVQAYAKGLPLRLGTGRKVTPASFPTLTTWRF